MENDEKVFLRWGGSVIMFKGFLKWNVRIEKREKRKEDELRCMKCSYGVCGL